jgi:kynurenine 3-monooxygenase
MTTEKKEITLIGAGLVGSLLSIYLAKKGHQVNVFERRSDMRKASNYAGRSIN